MGDAQVGKGDSMSRREDVVGMPCLAAVVPLNITEIINVHTGPAYK